MPESNISRIWMPTLMAFVFYCMGLQVWRLYFTVYNDLPITFATFTAGYRLDISMICGVLLTTCIPFWVLHKLNKQIAIRYWIASHILMWTIISVVDFSSALLYPEWGSTLDARAVSYLTHPKEMWASVNGYLPVLPVIWAGIVIIAGWVLIAMKGTVWMPIYHHGLKNSMYTVILTAMVIVGLRGGIQKLPVTPSDAFKSQNMPENFASVNKVWYFIYSILHQQDLRIASSDQAIEKFKLRYSTSSYKLSDNTPDWSGKNIVLIIMEGWSADMVSYLEGTEGVTPFFDSIAQYSLQFNNLYASGFRTDQGILSILSGIPSIGGENLLNNTRMVSKFPSLPATLRKAGYHTSFFYGGDMNFANMDFYIRSLGFDTIRGGGDFSEDVKSTDWGVPDHIVLTKAAEYMKKSATPFFSTVLLLSSHAPFEIPWVNQFTQKDDIPSKYKASVHYSDQSLRHFFSLMETMKSHENTVYIITTDHGSTHSGNAGLESPMRFKIPAIVYQPANKEATHKLYNSIGNQTNLPYSISAAVGIHYTDFAFSRNIFDADTTRIACWSTDVYAACTHDLLSFSHNKKHYSSQAELYQDMVKKWIQTL